MMVAASSEEPAMSVRTVIKRTTSKEMERRRRLSFAAHKGPDENGSEVMEDIYLMKILLVWLYLFEIGAVECGCTRLIFVLGPGGEYLAKDAQKRPSLNQQTKQVKRDEKRETD